MTQKARQKQCPIGIDMSGRLITAVQMGRSRRERRIAAATSIRRTAWGKTVDVEEVQRFAGVLDRQGFLGRDVVVAMPSESLFTAVLELPPRDSGAPLDKIARVELATAHKYDPDTIESAFWELPAAAHNREGMSAMAVGCPSKDANALLDIFESARFNVQGLDVKSWAVTRGCDTVLSQISGLAAILNIEWKMASLVVISDGVVVYERRLPKSGMCSLHESLVEDLDLDADVADYLLRELGFESDGEEKKTRQELATAVRERISEFVDAMVPEIRMSLGYAAQEYGQSTIDRLIILGEAADIPGFVRLVSTQLGVHATTIAPSKLAACDCTPETICDSASMITAFGLAQYPNR